MGRMRRGCAVALRGGGNGRGLMFVFVPMWMAAKGLECGWQREWALATYREIRRRGGDVQVEGVVRGVGAAGRAVGAQGLTPPA